MKKHSRVQNSILNLITAMGGQFLVIAMKFVTRTVFIHTLGEAYLGINGYFSDVLSMLSLTELGLDMAINFKLYKPLAEGDNERLQVLMKFYRNAYRAVGTAIFLLGLLLIPALPTLIRNYDSLADLGINAVLIFLLYLLQSSCSYLFFAYRSAIVKADQRIYLLNVAGYAVTVGTNLCQIAILLIWKNFILYTAVVIFFNILKNFIHSAIAKKNYPQAFAKTDKNLDRAEIRDMFKDLGALFIYKVNDVVLKATDNIVLGAFVGLTIVGRYSNYLMFYTAIVALLGKFYTAIKASMGNLFAASDLEKSYRFFETMNFLSAILYGTACVGVAVVADELIRCWIGERFVIPQPLALLIGIEILFVGLKKNLGQIRNVTGAFRQMWFRPVMGILINIVLSVALVGPLGIYGVLIGTIVADFFANFLVDPVVIYRYSFQGLRPVSAYYIKNCKYFLLLLVALLLDGWLCALILPGRGWLSVFVHALLCAATVPGVLCLACWKTHELEYLRNLARRLLGRLRGSRA